MGLLDELKRLTRPYDEEDEYDDDEEYDDEELPEEEDDEPARRNLRRVTPRTPVREIHEPVRTPQYQDSYETTSRNSYRDSYSTSSRTPYRESYEAPSRRADPGKVVNINTTTQLQVVLVKPEKFENASDIADHLREKRTVVLNLESTNKDVARRLVDFLSGVAYAQEGKIKKISAATYIITPYNVDIIGDLIDELENNGLYF